MQRTKGGPFTISRKLAKHIRSCGLRSIYFVQERDTYPDGLTKIGVATNVVERLSSLQIGSPRELALAECLFFQYGGDYSGDMMIWRSRRGDDQVVYDSLLRLEGLIHSQLKEYGAHVRGEWFAGGIDAVWNVANKVLDDAVPDLMRWNFGATARGRRLDERLQQSYQDRTWNKSVFCRALDMATD